MTHHSSTEVLTLHAVRLLGFAPTVAVTGRFGLDETATGARLEEMRAADLVSWSEFAGLGGWSLTVAGRAENERLLTAELDAADARGAAEAAHTAFGPLNAEVTGVLTAVQLAPAPELDETTHTRLTEVAASWNTQERMLVSHLARFEGYHRRFRTALFRADGDPAWLAGTSVDSCHRVWFELHEDLVATLGLTR